MLPMIVHIGWCRHRPCCDLPWEIHPFEIDVDILSPDSPVDVSKMFLDDERNFLVRFLFSCSEI